MQRNFTDLLRAQWARGLFSCVGLDTDYPKIPACVKGSSIISRMMQFNSAIIQHTHDVAGAYKPNFAFYVARWKQGGLDALYHTIDCIRKTSPETPVVLDCKDADIGNTNNGYLEMALEFGADAITTNPYFGGEALTPFLSNKDLGVIVLCRTSNPGSDEFQGRMILTDPKELMPLLDRDNYYTGMDMGWWDLPGHGMVAVPMYQLVALQVARYWNTNSNCALVVGATYPNELQRIRHLVPDIPLLIPAVGEQGGDAATVARLGRARNGAGFIVNNSRGIIFASNSEDYAEVARQKTIKLNEQIAAGLQPVEPIPA